MIRPYIVHEDPRNPGIFMPSGSFNLFQLPFVEGMEIHYPGGEILFPPDGKDRPLVYPTNGYPYVPVPTSPRI